MEYYIFFDDVKSGQALYEKMKEHHVACTIAPTPRTEDKCCGISILYENGDDRDKIEKIIDTYHIPIRKFYEKEKDRNPNRMRFC